MRPEAIGQADLAVLRSVARVQAQQRQEPSGKLRPSGVSAVTTSNMRHVLLCKLLLAGTVLFFLLLPGAFREKTREAAMQVGKRRGKQQQRNAEAMPNDCGHPFHRVPTSFHRQKQTVESYDRPDCSQRMSHAFVLLAPERGRGADLSPHPFYRQGPAWQNHRRLPSPLSRRPSSPAAFCKRMSIWEIDRPNRGVIRR